MLQAYLYIRMYYNKIRKTVHHWWQSYLLFKCSIVVLPVYSALIILGLYCIMYDIDVNAPLKTVYQFIILILSAAVIFIFVLLLATFNGDNRPPDMNDEPFEVDLDSISLPQQRNFRSGGRRGRNGNRSSISSSIWSAIFGNYNEEDEEFDDEEFLDPEDLMTLAAVEAHQHDVRHGQISTFDDLPPLMMNQAESRLINSLERATDGLEFFFDQCNSFDLSPEDHMVTPPRLVPGPSSKPFQLHRFAPPPGYYDHSASSMQYNYGNTIPESRDNYHLHPTSILPAVGAPLPTLGGHLAPPMPPQYSSTNNLAHCSPSPSTVVDIHILKPSTSAQNFSENSTMGTSSCIAHDLPPSYEEATRK